MQKYWPEKRYRGKDNIWVALNRVTQSEVILKYFPMDTSDEYKISREAYTMKYLYNEDPKHFLELYDYMEDPNENQYTIAMEKAECSLEDIVTERGYLPEEEAIPVLREILYALQVMHKNNFIHRDLKLSNILLRKRDDLSSVTIIDFGETVDRTEDYYITGVVGTLHYMAPEILKKKKYYKPVDIWAIGVIAYRLLTGYFPYITQGDNHSKQLKAILNNEVSYLRYDNKRVSTKAIDFINCLLDVDPQTRMGIQAALDHPFLNPYFEGEFIPYRPLPKLYTIMAKDNVQDGKIIKRLLTKAVRRTKKQDVAGESERIIKTLFNKDKQDTEPNDVNDTEDTGVESKIHYSKTCVQPKTGGNSLNYSHTTYQSDPFYGGSQTINRINKKHNQNEDIPAYLNVTLGRNNLHNNGDYIDENDYDNVKFSNTYVPPTGNTAGNVDEYIPPTGNTAGNINYQSNEYIPPTGNTAGNINYPSNTSGNNNGQNNYSNNYASSVGSNNSNNYLKPKLPKTAGNSIDPYANSYDDYNVNNNNGYSSSPNMNNNTMNNNNYQKPPKTAGNSIDPYGNFQKINNFEGKHIGMNRHSRAYSDSTKQVDHSEEYYQNFNTLPNKGNRNYDNENYDRRNYAANQFSERYGNEIRKSNTVNNTSMGKSTKISSPLHDPLSIKSDGYHHQREDDRDSLHSHHRKTSSSGSHQLYENGDLNTRHRKTSSSGSRPRYDDDSNGHHRTSSSGSRPRYDDDSNGHHRRTSSSGSRPRYDDDSYGHRINENSSNIHNMPMPHVSPLTSLNDAKSDNYGKPYSSKRPSPLVNTATIKTSNSTEPNSLSSKKNEIKGKNENSKSSKLNQKTKNILPVDIKLKIDPRPKKLPPVVSNHPSRNSSLHKNKK